MEPNSSVVEGVVETTEASLAASDAPSPTEQNFRNLIAQVRARYPMEMQDNSLVVHGRTRHVECRQQRC